MDEAVRHALVQQLGQEMSDISEDCYCAGWLGGTEYLVPELCRRAAESGYTQHWGHGEITPELGRQLILLAEQAGCWANTDFASVAYDPFQPFPIPLEYTAEIDREQAFWRDQQAERLGSLALQFRRAHNDETRGRIARHYSDVVDRLIQSGLWQEIPPLENQLPDDWMPKAFLAYWSNMEGSA